MKRRLRLKEMTTTLEQRMEMEARQLRAAAERLPPCRERDHLLRDARRADTAANINAWLISPGLRAPL